MNLKKLYRNLSIFVLVFAAFLLGLYSWWSHLGEPRYSGNVKLHKLSASVTVDYNEYGVPHIKAASEEDAFRTLGYVMAQDRLFQMDMLRRVVRGELAEVIGKKAVPSDLLFRQLSLISTFQERYEKGEMNREMITMMKAFYDGVNTYIDEGNFPYEYTLLGMTPGKFDVMDGYGVLGYMAYSFAQSFKTDLFFDELKKTYGEEYVNSLRAYPRPKAKKKVSSDLNRNRDYEMPQEFLWQKANRFLEEYIGLFEGSNAWALSGKKTKSGMPMLASDPHVQFTLPGIWYEAVVDWGDGAFSGLYAPGVPFPALGHRKELGWGVTISYIDDMDFYREKRKGDQVFYKGEWVDLKKRVEVIKVKGEDDITVNVMTGPHGPLLEGIHPLLKEQLAMKWGHLREDNRAPLAFYRMMKATNIDAFKNAMARAKSPGLNIIYTDDDGNIGRYLFGSVPMRPAHMTGDLIYDGSVGVNDYDEDQDFFERAHIENPERGFVVSANSKPEDLNLPGYYQPEDRYDTIAQLVAAKDKWSLEEMKYVQTAYVDIYHLPLRDVFLRVLTKQDYKEGSDYRKGLKLLKEWSGQSTVDSVATTIFQTLKRQVAREMLAPITEKSDENFQLYCETNFFDHHVNSRLLRGVFKEKFVVDAYKVAIDSLIKENRSLENASWGEFHRVSFAHPLAKGGAMLEKIFNVGPYPISGAKDNINNNRSVGCRNGFKVKAGPSSRRLIDYANPEESLAVSPLGNSGHWKSPFYQNQWPLFEKGEYRASLLKGELSEKERFGRLIFAP